MATPSAAPTQMKSRGLTLFDRQAQLHAQDADRPISVIDIAPISVKPVNSISSPSVIHRRHLQSTLVTPHSHSNIDNAQLIGGPLRSELTSAIDTSGISQKFLETDFPFNEKPTECTARTSIPSDSLCCVMVEQAFDYLEKNNDNDDDDNDVIHQNDSELNQYYHDDYNETNSDGNESVDTIDLDATTSTHNQYDSGIHTLSSQGNSDTQQSSSQEKLCDNQSQMALSSRGTGSEDNDSDFDNQSHDDDIDNDDEQLTNQKNLIDEQEEQRRQLIVRQQKLLWSIEQEWLRKEKSYIEQLEKLEQQLSYSPTTINLQSSIQQLIVHHKNVCKEIEYLYERDHQPLNLIKQLTRAIEALMPTLTVYDNCIDKGSAQIRKALEKRLSNNGMSAEDFISILPKQFLQILSQIQDLYKTALSFESEDKESLLKLYDFSTKCKLFGGRQDESINQIILKNEDVVVMGPRGTRDRSRLILYPDVIVCCTLKTRLLQGPKYSLVWFIPIINLHLTAPQISSDDNSNTDAEIKSNLKSAYKELEKLPKSNPNTATRISKSIRKHENEYNLVQSKLQLILSNGPFTSSGRSSIQYAICFSSAYQRQEWIDLIDKTKQDLVQRSTTLLDPVNKHYQRLTESLIQKRLDLVKANVNECNSHESTIQLSPGKTYSGTLLVTIYSIQGTALYNPIRSEQTLPKLTSGLTGNNYEYYVAVEIDSYNTFYPYAQTAKRPIQQHELVEFRGEVFQVELEYSSAFRLLIYRTDTKSSTDNISSSQRAQCIGKFHRSIETALKTCDRASNGILVIESPSDDLRLRISLKYSEREGTFKRQGSKRSLAVFGKSIEKLVATPNRCIDGIPRIVVKCIQIVEHDGLQETGIYRVCCVASDLQKLRHLFDRDCHRGEIMLAEKNVHVAANLLKLFFRELPEPLFTTVSYKQLLNAVQLTDVDNQRVTLLKTLESLPSDNRRILLYLLDHLIHVSQYSDINMMHLENLAVVFGPTLMRPSRLTIANHFSGSNQRLNNVGNNTGQTELDNMSTELQGSMHQCQVVLACLKFRRDGILK